MCKNDENKMLTKISQFTLTMLQNIFITVHLVFIIVSHKPEKSGS
jgi:hypothetical protein